MSPKTRSHTPQVGVSATQSALGTIIVYDLPFSAGSFDVVVSFEVIEHLQQWAGLIAEARRVLVPEGLFIVSTPNKSFYAKARADSGPNPFHEHEFEVDEFRDALTRVFPHVVIAFENHAGCVLFESPQGAGIDARIDGFSGPEDANFYVAVCSAQARPVPSFVFVPESANLLKERGTRIQSLETELQLKNAWLEEAQNKHAELGPFAHSTNAGAPEQQHLG